MRIAYLNTPHESRQGVGDTMGDQFPIDVEVVFLDSGTQSRNVDWHVDDAKER